VISRICESVATTLILSSLGKVKSPSPTPFFLCFDKDKRASFFARENRGCVRICLNLGIQETEFNLNRCDFTNLRICSNNIDTFFPGKSQKSIAHPLFLCFDKDKRASFFARENRGCVRKHQSKGILSFL